MLLSFRWKVIFPIRLCQRFLSRKALMYSNYGDPENVLSLATTDLKPIGDDEIVIKMCAAPIHPSDINTIQGVYALKPPLPAVGGNEGVGRVIECGPNVKDFSVNDLVVPTSRFSGTWQTHISGKSTEFFRLPFVLPLAHAAVFRVNPATALLMLTDFVKLHPNDIVIQNGATSAVGIYGIQMAKHLGIKTINLFRPRSSPEATEATRQVLLDYGATWALTEAEFTDSTNSMAKDAKAAGPVHLGLNCLGGRPTLTIMKVLADSGTLVSYGAMTRSPMPIPVFPLIFRDIRLRGFWVTGWLQRANSAEITRLFTQIAEWFSSGVLRPSPYLEVPFNDWKKAFSLTAFNDSGPTGITKKVILTME